MMTHARLGVGYRPELALAIERRSDLTFVEILAEDYQRPVDIPQALKLLQKRGVEVLVHSLSLSLGQAPAAGTKAAALSVAGAAREPVGSSWKGKIVSGFKLLSAGDEQEPAVERERIKNLRRHLKHLDALARYFDSPFVSDHIAFVRAGELESGHLLPVERSEAMLALLYENISLAKEVLSVPLVLENIACTFDQPGAEMDEATFVARVIQENDCGLLLDLSNLFANSHNMHFSAPQYLGRLPLDRLQYAHLAGGTFKRGLYHDTHCHPLKDQSLTLLAELLKLKAAPRVMLERDDSFPPEDEFNSELDAIKTVLASSVTEQAVPEKSIADKLVLKNPVLENLVPRLTLVTKPAVCDSEKSDKISQGQAALMQALLGLAAVPAGFDRELIEDAAQALKRKRLRAMRRAHPCLESTAEEVLFRYFEAFPSVPPAGPGADGEAFHNWQKQAETAALKTSPFSRLHP